MWERSCKKLESQGLYLLNKNNITVDITLVLRIKFSNYVWKLCTLQRTRPIWWGITNFQRDKCEILDMLANMSICESFRLVALSFRVACQFFFVPWWILCLSPLPVWIDFHSDNLHINVMNVKTGGVEPWAVSLLTRQVCLYDYLIRELVDMTATSPNQEKMKMFTN